MVDRRRAYWMNPKDDRILEYLGQIHPSALPVTALYWNLQEVEGIEFSQETMERRLGRLVEVGLVEIPRGKNSMKNRFYRITGSGIAYLEGDLQPDELPEDFDGDE